MRDVGNATRWPAIVKSPEAGGTLPNLLDYGRTWAGFSWEDARRRLDGLPGGRGLNIAHGAIDRHAAGVHGNHVVLQVLTRVAPEIDTQSLRPDGRFREEFDLDSMDFLNLSDRPHAGLGVDVPETDYATLTTLRGAVDYLASRLAA